MERNISDILSVLLKKIWYIIGTAVLFAIAAALYTSLFITPLYTSSVSLWAKTGDEVSEYQEALTIQYRIQTYAEFFTVPVTLEMASDRLNEIADEVGDDGLRYSAKQLEGMISVSISEGSEFITIRITNSNPAYAQLIANVVAESGSTVISYDEANGGMGVGVVKMVGNAELPRSPSSPSMVRNVLIAALIGLILSSALFAAFFYFDTSIKYETDIIDITGRPVIGTVPTIDSIAEKRA